MTFKEKFLPYKIVPNENDKIILSSSFIFPLNIFMQSAFSRPKYKKQTIVVNAANGRVFKTEGEITMMERPEHFNIIRELTQKYTLDSAFFIADTSAVPDDSKGWRRAVNTARIMFNEDEFSTAKSFYILRGKEIIDPLTGQSEDAGEVIDILIG